MVYTPEQESCVAGLHKDLCQAKCDECGGDLICTSDNMFNLLRYLVCINLRYFKRHHMAPNFCSIKFS